MLGVRMQMAAAREKWKDLEFFYTGSAQSALLPVGTYLLKAWGAEGYGSAAGLGGYATGKITIASPTTVYVYVGGQAVGQTGGWNGGGDGSGINGETAGGGATDFRMGGSALTNRFLVAGGGGGRGSKDTRANGHGGGVVGTDSDPSSGGYGGTQSAGGADYGAWGVGGAYSLNRGGGGGGWYGGGCGRASYFGGGGGSSYIGGTVTTQGIDYPVVLITDGSTTAGQRSGDGYATISKI